jgi:hypothetical protein
MGVFLEQVLPWVAAREEAGVSVTTVKMARLGLAKRAAVAVVD